MTIRDNTQTRRNKMGDRAHMHLSLSAPLQHREHRTPDEGHLTEEEMALKHAVGHRPTSIG